MSDTQNIAVKAPDGTFWEVPKNELANLPSGASIADPAEFAKVRAEKKYGGAEGAATAAALGVARGLSFGLSDQAYMAAGHAMGNEAGVREFIKGTGEANPVASTAGEAASLLVPVAGELAAGSKLGRAAEAASVLQRGVFGAGRAAESVAGNIVGREAESALGRAAQAGIRHGAAGALEGAAYGVGNEISDAAINDHDLTAEKLWAAAGHGALIGGSIGGGLGAVGELGSSAVKGISSNLLKNKSLQEFLEHKSGESMLRAVGVPRPAVRGISRTVEGGVGEAGNRIADVIEEYTGKNVAKATRDDLPGVLSRLTDETSTKSDELFSKLGKEAQDLMPKAEDIVADTDSIIGRLENTPLAKPSINKLNEFKSDIQRITGITDDSGNIIGYRPITPREYRDFRTVLDKNIKYESLSPEMKGFQKEFYALRDKMETRFEDSIDAAGKHISEPELLKDYKDIKKDWQAVKWLQRAVENDSVQSGTNLGINLTEKIAGATTAHIGAMFGGPVGAALGAVVGMAGSHLARQHGEFIASAGLRKIATLAAAERASIAIDNRIADGVSAFLRGSRGEEVRRSMRERPPAAIMADSRALTAMAGNPDAMMAHIQSRIGNLGPMAPNLTSALAAKAANDVQFLASKAPHQRLNLTSLTPQLEKTTFSDDQARIFARYFRAVTDPMTVIDDLKSGKVTREGVEAFKATRPKLYEQTKMQVVEECQKLGDKLSYEKRLQLGILFQAPTDETLTPEFIRSMQQTTAPPAPEPKSPKQQQGGGRRPIDLHSTEYALGNQVKGEGHVD